VRRRDCLENIDFWEDKKESLDIKGLYYLPSAAMRNRFNLGLEGCGPSQPSKPIYALFPREIPFSTSGISGTPPGYDGA
jgi:hypothetical protein